jgi:hypothetical protein
LSQSRNGIKIKVTQNEDFLSGIRIIDKSYTYTFGGPVRRVIPAIDIEYLPESLPFKINHF